MKRRRVTIVICLVVLLCLTAFFWYRHTRLNRISGLQPMMIMAEGRRYVHNGEALEQRPEGPPDGRVTKINHKTDYPDEDGEANFGTVGMPYWRVENEVVVEASKYYLFEES